MHRRRCSSYWWSDREWRHSGNLLWQYMGACGTKTVEHSRCRGHLSTAGISIRRFKFPSNLVVRILNFMLYALILTLICRSTGGIEFFLWQARQDIASVCCCLYWIRGQACWLCPWTTTHWRWQRHCWTCWCGRSFLQGNNLHIPTPIFVNNTLCCSQWKSDSQQYKLHYIQCIGSHYTDCNDCHHFVSAIHLTVNSVCS